MITILKQAFDKKRTNFLKSDLNKCLVKKMQIPEYPKRIWFKGSRFR